MRKTKYTVKYTTGFKKDYKRAIKRGLKIELLEQVGDTQEPDPLATLPDGHVHCVLTAQFEQEPPEHCFPSPQDELVQAQEYVVPLPVRVHVGVVDAQLLGLQASIHPPEPFATAGDEHLQSVAPAAQATQLPAEHFLPAAQVTPAHGSTHLFERQT